MKQMPLKARIARLLDDGACATLEDPFAETLIAEGKSQDPKRICLRAAKRLRELAWKFEQLSEEENPFSQRAQNRVHRMRAPSPNASPSATEAGR